MKVDLMRLDRIEKFRLSSASPPSSTCPLMAGSWQSVKLSGRVVGADMVFERIFLYRLS